MAESHVGFLHSVMQYKEHRVVSWSPHKEFVTEQVLEGGSNVNGRYIEIEVPLDQPGSILVTSLKTHHAMSFPSQSVQQQPQESIIAQQLVRQNLVQTYLPKNQFSVDSWRDTVISSASQQNSPICPHYSKHILRDWAKETICMQEYPYKRVPTIHATHQSPYIQTTVEYEGKTWYMSDIPKEKIYEELSSLFHIQYDKKQEAYTRPNASIITVGLLHSDKNIKPNNVGTISIDFPWFQIDQCITSQYTLLPHCIAPKYISNIDISSLTTLDNLPCVRGVSIQQYNVQRRAHTVMMSHAMKYKGALHLKQGKKFFQSLQKTFQGCVVYPIVSKEPIHTNQDAMVLEKVQSRLSSLKDKKTTLSIQKELEYIRILTKLWKQQYVLLPLTGKPQPTAPKDTYQWIYQTIPAKDILQTVVKSVMQDYPSLQLDLSLLLRLVSKQEGDVYVTGRTRQTSKKTLRQDLKNIKRDYIGCVYSVTASSKLANVGYLHRHIKQQTPSTHHMNRNTKRKGSIYQHYFQSKHKQWKHSSVIHSFSRNMPDKAQWYNTHSSIRRQDPVSRNTHRFLRSENHSNAESNDICEDQVLYKDVILPSTS